MDISKQIISGLGLIIIGGLFIFPLVLPRWFSLMVGVLAILMGLLIFTGKLKV